MRQSAEVVRLELHVVKRGYTVSARVQEASREKQKRWSERFCCPEDCPCQDKSAHHAERRREYMVFIANSRWVQGQENAAELLEAMVPPWMKEPK